MTAYMNYTYTTLSGKEFPAKAQYVGIDEDTTNEVYRDTLTSQRMRKRNAKRIIEARKGQPHWADLSELGLDLVSRISFHNAPTQWGECESCSSSAHLYTYSIDLHGFPKLRGSAAVANPEVQNTSTWTHNPRYTKCAKCVSFSSLKRLWDLLPSAYLDMYTLLEIHATQYSEIFPLGTYAFPEATEPEPLRCVCFSYANPNDSNVIEIAGRDKTLMVHKTCLTCCATCGDLHVNARAYRIIPEHFVPMQFTTFGGRHTCQACKEKLLATNEWTMCGGCAMYERTTNIRYSEVRDIDLCVSCYNYPVECRDCGYSFREGNSHTCYLEQGSHIYEYSFKPRAKFFGNAQYWLGFELEVEYQYADDDGDCNTMAYEITNKLDSRVYCKYDGSLDNGFEVVSHPHSLEEFHTKFDWSFMRDLRDRGFESWDNSNCGIHVHVSRSAFEGQTRRESDSHLIRFAKFIYDNQNQVERIAGRKENEFALFSDKGHVVSKILAQRQEGGRYEVVNIANSKTIEIRIFRGSLRRERLLSDIEFVHAVVEFTRNMKVVHKNKPFAWSRFVKFVVENDTQYPNLNTILDEAFNSERIKETI